MVLSELGRSWQVWVEISYNTFINQMDSFRKIKSLSRTYAPFAPLRPLKWRRVVIRFLLPAILLVACRQEEVSTPVPEEIVMVGEQEVVVTRVIRQTIEVKVTPVVEIPEQPVTLDISFQGGYDSLDPQLLVTENALNLIESTLVGLTRYDLATDTIQPQLATHWEISPDGLTWTFHLRDDIFWIRHEPGDINPLSQGDEGFVPVRPVIAGDVQFAIRRACDPRVATPDIFIIFIIKGCEHLYDLAEVTSEDVDEIGVMVIDDQTLEIELTRPGSHFLTMTSMWLLRAVPPELVQEMGQDEWHKPQNIWSSGPFVFSPETLPDSRTVLLRNPYWPMPFNGNVDQVNILHLDISDAFLLWEDRQLDIGPLPLEDRSRILNRYELKTMLVPRQEVFYLAFNFESPAFRVPAGRQAFAWAIDRERLIREVHGGEALPMRHFGPEGVIGAPPIDEVGVGYSPDRARLAIDNSGFGDCRLMPQITYLVSGSDLALQQAELLREMWMEELGCDRDQIVIEQVQFGILLARTRPDAGTSRPDIWDLGWASYYPDENNWLGDVLHCSESENRQNRLCTPTDEIISQANLTTDPQERVELYRQAERELFGEEGLTPIAPLFVRAQYVLRHGWVDFNRAHFGGEQYDTYLVDMAVKLLEQER